MLNKQFDTVKDLILETISENNIQYDYECVADFYETYLTAIDPADIDLSLLCYAFYFNPESDLLKGHLEQYLKSDVHSEEPFNELMAVFINMDDLEISN